jgi:hypothetical protein
MDNQAAAIALEEDYDEFMDLQEQEEVSHSHSQKTESEEPKSSPELQTACYSRNGSFPSDEAHWGSPPLRGASASLGGPPRVHQSLEDNSGALERMDHGHKASYSCFLRIIPSSTLVSYRQKANSIKMIRLIS